MYHGNHTLTVLSEDETVHSRSLYIEQERLNLTVSLPGLLFLIRIGLRT